MVRKISILLSAAVLCIACLGGGACKRMEPDRGTYVTELTSVAHPFPDAIPAEYGELVGVTWAEEGFAVLAFEKRDKTIVLLGLRPYEERGLARNAILIPRR